MRAASFAASASLIALIFLDLAWELRLAPLAPGGSALVFKVLPLLAPLFGILNGRRYTYKWASLLILLYFAEGLVRAASDAAPSRWLALGEVALSVAFFAAAVTYVRLTRAPRPAPAP